MPGCIPAEMDATADWMYEMSGSRVLLSGVGTQMFTASTFASSEKSVVARSPPGLTVSASSASLMSMM